MSDAYQIVAVCGVLSILGLILSAAIAGIGFVWDSEGTMKIAGSFAIVCGAVLFTAIVLSSGHN